ncbi:hypothetical protein Xmir_00571 [Xenorhabdus miraniensis]|uniref:Uncharacterized protein n=1 Tax=Xenorhabdus miraniensis TaxID=351674 RepID=A0A2D0JVI8_9GAMM|nr:hypothetical protein Xmir_00571 [Xenorhabdus miraniensis]
MKIIKFSNFLVKLAIYLLQSFIISISSLSLISLVYFGLLTNFENKYLYVFISIGGLVFSALLYYLTEKIKEKYTFFQ